MLRLCNVVHKQLANRAVLQAWPKSALSLNNDTKMMYLAITYIAQVKLAPHSCSLKFVQHQKSSSNWSIARTWFIACPCLGSAKVRHCADHMQHDLACCLFDGSAFQSPTCINSFPYSESCSNMPCMPSTTGEPRDSCPCITLQPRQCLVLVIIAVLLLHECGTSDLALGFLCWCVIAFTVALENIAVITTQRDAFNWTFCQNVVLNDQLCNEYVCIDQL